MVSILDILSGAAPLMVDVRQTGGSPQYDRVAISRERYGEQLSSRHRDDSDAVSSEVCHIEVAYSVEGDPTWI
jgi:hypothetical protein